MSHERIYLRDHLVFEGDDGSGFDSDYLHTALFCAHCGEVWARVLRKNSSDYWAVVIRPCDKHEGGFLYDPGYCDLAAKHFSGTLLAREFVMQTQFIERLLTERNRT